MKWLLAFGLVSVLSLTSTALTLDEYLNIVKQKNRNFTALELSLQSSNDKRAAGDLALTPQLTAGYSMASDKSLPSSVADERKVNEYNLGVAKKFSSGTALSLSAKTDEFSFSGPVTPAITKYSTGSLGVSLQQSLWKDSFGAANRLRNDREFAINKAETMGLELKRRGVLIEAESSFWDYAVALEDLKLKQENLERARKIDKWTSNRVANGISDRSDLMNAKALASIRELELQTAQDELKSQEVRFRENLDLSEVEKTPEIKANLFETRPYVNELKQLKNVIKIESYISSLEAKSKRLVSEEINDGLKPDLSLIGSYNTSSYNSDYSQAVSDISKTDRPKSFIGLNFTWLFDTEAKRSQVSAASKDALAAQYTADKKRVEGLHAWKEHLRKYEVTQENVKTLEKIAKFQRERAKAEQDKFSKGRTITASVVTAETDSAEAEVRFLKAKSGLRKLEASTLLFTSVQE
jgi:outer membrane protein TolC